MVLSDVRKEAMRDYIMNKYMLFRRGTDESKRMPLGEYSEAYIDYLKIDHYVVFDHGYSRIIAEFRFEDKDSYHNKFNTDMLATTVHIEIGNNNYFYKEFKVKVNDFAQSQELFFGYLSQYILDIVKSGQDIGNELVELHNVVVA